MPKNVPELKTPDGRMNEVGVRVRARRRALKLRQEDVAARLDTQTEGAWKAGRRDIYRIESGTRKVTDIEIRCLATVLGLTPCELLVGFPS